MRKSLCIGMILRSDDAVGSRGTLATMLHLGYAARDLDVEVEFLPVSGAPHALARNIVVGAFLGKNYTAGDLLFLDYGNSVTVGGEQEYVYTKTLLQVLLASEEPALCCPTPRREEGNGASTAYNVCLYPSDFTRDGMHVRPQAISTEPLPEIEAGAKVHMMRLEACGFAFVRLRRDAVERVFRTGDRFVATEPTSGAQIECSNCFGEIVEDCKHYSEDLSFWRRAKRVGIEPKALIDFPVSHGWRQPGVNCMTFRDAMRLPMVGAAPEPPRIILANGV